MKKIVILTTDTYHHRFFINYLMKKFEFSSVIFEDIYSHAKFKTGPFLEDEEKQFEFQNFFKNTSSTIPDNIKSVKNINNQESLDILREIDPDFGIVFGTGKISEEIISLFNDGLINVHRGVAEKYRGLDSDLWAIYHGDYLNIGVTIHQVFPKLDTGDILFSEVLELNHEIKIYQIRYYTTLIASRLVQKSIKNYLDGRLKLKPQVKLGRYYSYMPLDLKRLVRKKFDLYCKSLKVD